jgi:hypothetical protein
MRRIAFAIIALLGIITTPSAFAQVSTITQAKALAGNVTPGDTAGYPITISQPGAYRLDSNLTVPNGQYGIFVGVNNVDIDMNGFTLTGSGVGTYGVISNSGESRIHDGVINRFRYSGIYLRNNAWTIDNMQIVRNGGMGVDSSNFQYLTIQKSLIAANGGYGIQAGDNASIYVSTVSNNSIGVVCNYKCRVESSTLSNNTTYGAYMGSGIALGNIFAENGELAIRDDATLDVGQASNIFIGNSAASASLNQRQGIDLTPNQCVGKPC